MYWAKFERLPVSDRPYFQSYLQLTGCGQLGALRLLWTQFCYFVFSNIVEISFDFEAEKKK